MGQDRWTGTDSRSPKVAAAVAALLVGAWSVPALSATDSVVECPSISGDLNRADVYSAPLSISAVDLDHISTDEPQPADNPIEIAPEEAESPTPILYLTPRVASILREVFGSNIEGVEDVEAASQEEAEDPQDSVPMAETIDAADAVDGEEISPEGPAIERSEELRRFQQQMYRTDI